ncbi:hypothetical protein H310_12673 [Aphanomyces invadans]|uniref:Uncharacterized protein n=1 Tax=Aphanomyces invadans TaxID=157072 RepID=A0A024THB5_9STRA|nr:hypothetical protein H310_12673 [Aphanomyces invadans]ETV93428.1 hypothetical protein H310_12673 [Aphanomyces invadans]|eukprot:XP_008878064.1 hypothetical protein H310_12673 [Aphanomyces invadans]
MTAPTKRAYYNQNKAYFQAYYQTHRDTLLAYARANHKRTYASRKDKKIQRAKEHHAQNRDKKLAQMKAYYRKTKARRLAGLKATTHHDTCCRPWCPSNEPLATDDDGAVTAAASAILQLRQNPLMSIQYLLNPFDVEGDQRREPIAILQTTPSPSIS